MVKFLLHFLFLVAGISYLARRARALLLAVARRLHGRLRRQRASTGSSSSASAEVADVNLDQSLLPPLTGGASQINVYGAIGGESVYRPNALTGDPNHLGIEL